MVGITWLGHGTFELTLDNGEVVLIDPWLSGNPAAPESYAPGRVDAILVTHGHFDHIGDVIPLAQRFKPKVIANHEIAAWLSSKGVTNASGMNTGGTQAASAALRVTMTQALHSSSIQDGSQMIYGGQPGGYVLRFADGRVAYFAGDTAVFGDMALIAELYQPELVFLPIGDHYTMDPKQASFAVRLLKPKKVIPMHFATFPILTGRPDELQALIDNTAHVWTLEPGKPVSW